MNESDCKVGWCGYISDDIINLARIKGAPSCFVCASTDPLFLVKCIKCGKIFCCGRHNDWRNHGCENSIYQSMFIIVDV